MSTHLACALPLLAGAAVRVLHLTSHPTQPDGVVPGNWIQTDADRRWFGMLRLYGPLAAFFDKSWRPSEFELVS